MTESITNLCDALDELSEYVLECWVDDRVLRDVYGWAHPPVTRHDLADIPFKIAESIRALKLTNIDDELQNQLEELPLRLKSLHSETVPNMFNGNGPQAIPVYFSTLDWIRQIISPLMGWETLQDNKALPKALLSRLRNIQTELDNLIPNKDSLSNQIQLINDATEAAESLPTDLHNLKEARAKVIEIQEDSSFDRKKITEHKTSVEAQLKSINELHEQAKQLIANCEDAYRITTTKGLAAAFDQRASDLKISMRWWVGGAFLSLMCRCMDWT